MSGPIDLEIFTDFICPWCYLCTNRIARLQREWQIQIHWSYYPLHPDTAPGGMPLEELSAEDGVDYGAMMLRLKTLMDEEGLPFNEHTNRIYNTRPAQELSRWADQKNGSPILLAPLYRAFFVKGRNIGDPETLFDIVEQSGLPVGEAREVLERGTMRQSIDEDWERAAARKVAGVPAFLAGIGKLVGAQPYEQLVRLLERAMAQRGEPSP